MRLYFLPWVACTRRGVGIAGCRWYTPIVGTRNSISWHQIRTYHRRIIKIGEFMERHAVCSVLITLLFVISWPSAYAGGQHGFSIKVFTSPDDQFWANSVIIEGEHEVMLVDAQLTKTNAERVLEEIRKTKKPLSIVYIT